jgi:hypothetical protein
MWHGARAETLAQCLLIEATGVTWGRASSGRHCEARKTCRRPRNRDDGLREGRPRCRPRLRIEKWSRDSVPGWLGTLSIQSRAKSRESRARQNVNREISDFPTQGADSQPSAPDSQLNSSDSGVQPHPIEVVQ